MMHKPPKHGAHGEQHYSHTPLLRYLENNQLESPFPSFLQQQPSIQYITLRQNLFVRFCSLMSSIILKSKLILLIMIESLNH